MRRLAIIGSGDFGHLISHFATVDNQFELLGDFDDFLHPKSRVSLGIVLGGTDQVYACYEQELFDEVLVAID